MDDDTMTDAKQFYDSLAQDYRLIFPDWHQSVGRQANILGDVFKKLVLPPPCTVLDCTCGIGTQAIALASLGYTVHGTDLSPQAIALAQQYTQEFDLTTPPTFAVADLLAMPTTTTLYDAVVSLDNAVAHFMNDTDLAQAIGNMYRQLNPDGLLLISLRDYDALIQEAQRATMPTVIDDAAGRRIVYQVWDWSDDRQTYDVQLFITQQQGDSWTTRCHRDTFRAVLRTDIEVALEVNQFKDIHWLMPVDSGFYQPIVVARK